MGWAERRNPNSDRNADEATIRERGKAREEKSRREFREEMSAGPIAPVAGFVHAVLRAMFRKKWAEKNAVPKKEAPKKSIERREVVP